MIELSTFVLHNLAARLFRRRRPLLGGFKLTHRCTLRCRMCPFWHQPADDIPYPQALTTLDRLQALGVRILIFEGGEPFLWHDGPYRLDDLVREAKQRFFRVGVTTNGTLPLESNADVIWVSIDGFQETHDTFRGPSFERIITHIDRSSHPRIYAHITIHRANVDEIPALVRYLSDHVRGITIQFYYPYPGSEDLSLSWPKRRHVLDQLIQLKRAGYPILDSTAALRALKTNRWRCYPWLIASAEPDGTVRQGCYLQGRAEIACAQCGFAAHTEMSLAFAGNPGAIWAGLRIFGWI